MYIPGIRYPTNVFPFLTFFFYYSTTKMSLMLLLPDKEIVCRTGCSRRNSLIANAPAVCNLFSDRFCNKTYNTSVVNHVFINKLYLQMGSTNICSVLLAAHAQPSQRSACYAICSTTKIKSNLRVLVVQQCAN